MLSADHLNIDGPPFPVKCVRKFRYALSGEVTYKGVCVCVCVCEVLQQKIHKVGKQKFTREALKENEVKMIKVVFLQKIVGRDI